MKDSNFTDFTFFVLGDSGTANGYAGVLANTILTSPLSKNFEFGIHVGDIIYRNPLQGTPLIWDDGSCQGYPAEYFQPYQNILNNKLSSGRSWATMIVSINTQTLPHPM